MRSSWGWLPLMAMALFTGRAAATELELPAELQWCEDLPTVAGKLGIDDVSEAGHSYRADGVYLVTGQLWGNAGNNTVIFEEFDGQLTLVEVEFRMFRHDSAWKGIVDQLNTSLGAGMSEVVAEGAQTPNGETITAQRTRHTYKDPDGGWEVVAHQMSNEIDVVKFSYDRERCRPAPSEDTAADVVAKPAAGDVDVFSYDPYADDPLHSDTRAKEIEEEKKKVEEEKKKEDDTTEIDWNEVDTHEADPDIEW
jgi:hypothetical protein